MRIRPFDAAPDVRRDLDVIAGTQNLRRALAFDPQACGPRQHEDPLGPRLVVLEASWAGLTRGSNPLDLHAGKLGKHGDFFIREVGRHVGE